VFATSSLVSLIFASPISSQNHLTPLICTSGSQLEVEEHWSEEFLESLVLEDPVSRDPCGLLETSVGLSLSSSGLTVPDPCESYHDSSYGDFTPTLDQSRCGMDSKESLDEFKSLPYFLDSCLSNLNSFANPVALSSSESLGKSQRVHNGHLSFDYLAQKRQEVDKTKMNQHEGHHSIPNLSCKSSYTEIVVFLIPCRA